MEFKEKLLYVRATLKLSQTEMAEQLGVGSATVSRWESGKCIPNKRDEYIFNLYCKAHHVVFPEENND